MSHKRNPIRIACQGVLSIAEAAELLRADHAVLEEAIRCGQIPTVERNGNILVDGPALISRFRQPQDRRSTMRREELDRLPAVVDVPTAGEILGVGRSCAYELVRSGQWPTPVLHLGRLIRIPTTPLIELLLGSAGWTQGSREVSRASR